MISNAAGNIIIYGIHPAVLPLYKNENNEILQGTLCVADGMGSALGLMAIAVTGEPSAYFLTTLELIDSSTYNLSGISAPGNTMVYLSNGYDKENPLSSLRSSVIASVKSDNEGNFTIYNVHNMGTSMCVWTCVAPEYAQIGSISCKAELIKEEENKKYSYAIFKASDYNKTITCTTCNGSGVIDGTICTNCNGTGSITQYKEPRFTVTGTCPQDSTYIYVNGPYQSAEDALTSSVYSMMSGTSNVDGTYTLAFNCTVSNGDFWKVYTEIVEDGEITIDSIAVSEGYVSCLSADTLITMADGSQRRIDSINVGDIVMSEHGNPVGVYKTSRGYFNTYHKLYHFEDGTVIDETRDHRFYNTDQGFWQLLKLWNIGDHALKQNGEKVALVSVEQIDEEAEQFGIWTDSGSYYANGFLSGMAACNRQLLANATAEQIANMMMSTEDEHLVQIMGLEGILP